MPYWVVRNSFLTRCRHQIICAEFIADYFVRNKIFDGYLHAFSITTNSVRNCKLTSAKSFNNMSIAAIDVDGFNASHFPVRPVDARVMMVDTQSGGPDNVVLDQDGAIVTVQK